MILAVINGGLGLKLAANTTGGEIAYGVVAGVVVCDSFPSHEPRISHSWVSMQ